MLLIATFACLRFGELAALRRSDVDLDRSVVRVVRSLAQMNDGKLIDQEPKSRAGRQHASRDRDEAIAAALGDSLAAAKEQADKPPPGTQPARRRSEAP